jgi:hypothetical protein
MPSKAAKNPGRWGSWKRRNFHPLRWSKESLYAHLLVLNEGARKRVAIVGMLSATPPICPEALVHFEGKRVRIFPHLDGAGLGGARRWQKQLEAARAKQVDLFDFSGLVGSDGTPIEDLCDLTKFTPEDLEADQTLRRMLP